MKEMRREYDRKLHDLDMRLKKSLAHEQDEIEDENEGMMGLRERLGDVRTRVAKTISKGDDLVTEHPLLVVGGALAIGVALGALFASRRKED